MENNNIQNKLLSRLQQLKEECKDREFTEKDMTEIIDMIMEMIGSKWKTNEPNEEIKRFEELLRQTFLSGASIKTNIGAIPNQLSTFSIVKRERDKEKIISFEGNNPVMTDAQIEEISPDEDVLLTRYKTVREDKFYIGQISDGVNNRAKLVQKIRVPNNGYSLEQTLDGQTDPISLYHNVNNKYTRVVFSKNGPDDKYHFIKTMYNLDEILNTEGFLSEFEENMNDIQKGILTQDILEKIRNELKEKGDACEQDGPEFFGPKPSSEIQEK